jgi:hypothetical protein
LKTADDAHHHALVDGDTAGALAAELELEQARADAAGFDQDLGEAVIMMVRLAAFHFPETLAACLSSVLPIDSIQSDIRELATAVVRFEAEGVLS